MDTTMYMVTTEAILQSKTNGSRSNNTYTDYYNDFYEPMNDAGPIIIFITLYIIIFLFGVFGNTLVVFVVARNKSMQSITNIFIVNLSIADLFLCLLALPFTPMSGLLKSWVFGRALCQLVPMSLSMAVHVSTLTSTAIAVDRYFFIVYPFKARMKLVTGIIIIIAIWVVSTAVSLPVAVYQELSRDPDDPQIYSCQEDWPEPTARQAYTVIGLILQYLIPGSIIAFCYTKVSLVLRARAKAKIGSGRASRERHALEIRRKRRTNKMLISMIVIFAICWLPINTMHIITDYHEDIVSSDYFLLSFFITHVIAMSSVIYNPLLYAGMNENFKKEFRQMLPCFGWLKCCLSCWARCCRNDTVGNGVDGKTGNGDLPTLGGENNEYQADCCGGRGRSPSQFTEVGETILQLSALKATSTNGKCYPQRDVSVIKEEGHLTSTDGCYTERENLVDKLTPLIQAADGVK